MLGRTWFKFFVEVIFGSYSLFCAMIELFKRVVSGSFLLGLGGDWRFSVFF